MGIDTDGRSAVYRITAIPENQDRRAFVESMLHRQFAMCHLMASRETLLAAPIDAALFRGAIPGLEAEACGSRDSRALKTLCLIVGEPRDDLGAIDGLYKLFGGRDARITVVFTPVSEERVMAEKFKVERMLSGKGTAFTQSISTRGDAASETSAVHRDLYHDSEETDFLVGALEALKNAALANGGAYKVMIFMQGECNDILEYLCSKLPILEKKTVGTQSFDDLCRIAGGLDAMIFDASRAAKMIGFSNRIRVNKIVPVASVAYDGGVSLGERASGIGENITTDLSAFNLGALISGVPGTGKTFAAMHIASQLVGNRRPEIAIISPTDEWNSFGHERGLHVIALSRAGTRFNFFKCDGSADTRRFYENLAMLLASASDAGPYTNTLEKCLLAAFRQVYSQGRAPDPVEVYEAIEEAIIEQHGKRGAGGVKYTKHGENARAALQNLRVMLNRPEFSKREGVDFPELCRKGVVFDLSGVSNKMKQFYYALLLNQVYGIADGFDTRGDADLRMLICLEEAQAIFQADRNYAATADLIQRIQDFRKRGVGLMLITHSVTDIEPAIRRLCQTKLYFRQSADVARFAANDLLFGEAEKDALIERLKGLEQRTCALNYLQGRKHIGADFARMPERTSEHEHEDLGETPRDDAATAEMKVRVVDGEGNAKEGVRLRLFYVGEKIGEGSSGSDGGFTVANVINGNAYRLMVLGDRRKNDRAFRVVGGELNIVKI